MGEGGILQNLMGQFGLIQASEAEAAMAELAEEANQIIEQQNEHIEMLSSMLESMGEDDEGGEDPGFYRGSADDNDDPGFYRGSGESNEDPGFYRAPSAFG
jgi:hypothetical protein